LLSGLAKKAGKIYGTDGNSNVNSWTKHWCVPMVCWWIDRSNQIKSHSINLTSNSECERGPREENVPILEKVTTCVQPPTSHTPSHILPVFFLVRACASKTSKIVKMSVYQRCKNIQLCLFFSFFGEKFIFAVDPVHCWSPLVHRSIQNNFTLFPRSAFLFLFLTCTSNFFLSRVLKLTTAIYYIYHIC
jgi:hypothetical protein